MYNTKLIDNSAIYGVFLSTFSYQKFILKLACLIFFRIMLDCMSCFCLPIYFPLFLCIDLWRRLSYLFLLFFGTLHSDAYIFPFLLCFWLLFFSQLFVRHPQTAILLFCISFPLEWSWSLSPVQCHEPSSIVYQVLLSIRSSPLNLFLTSTV